MWLSCDNIEIRIEIIIVKRFPADSLGFGFQLSMCASVCVCVIPVGLMTDCDAISISIYNFRLGAASLICLNDSALALTYSRFRAGQTHREISYYYFFQGINAAIEFDSNEFDLNQLNASIRLIPSVR